MSSARPDPFALPVLDLSGPAAAQTMRTVGGMFGMATVVNHGVAPALMQAQLHLARDFFARPLAEKLAIDARGARNVRGYQPFQSQTTDAQVPGDLKEGFIMGPDLPDDHPHVLARYPNTGTNRWPAQPPDFRARMERYVSAMNVLGRKLARVLAAALELRADYFDAALTDPLTYSQLLHYPASPDEGFARRFGAGAHVDWGLFTLLLQDDVGGLEVRDAAGDWRSVAPNPSAYTLIFGEMLVRLTDGAYRSALHRVARNTSGRSRYSAPTFFDPSYDYRVECVPTICSGGAQPRYPARSVAEHMLEMARQPLSSSAS